MNATLPHRFGLFDDAFRNGVRASAEALFPENDLGAPDHHDAELVTRTESYVRRLPPSQRPMVALMFILVELGAPLLTGRFKRFSRQPAAMRRKAVRTWRASWIYPIRMLGDALKATLGMVYLSHPKILKHIGEYKPFGNPDDALQVDVRAPNFAEAEG